MAQKHLHELLQEDQEPFQLKHFIADRRSQLKKLDDKIVKKQKSISSNTTLLCKHACFFSVRDQSSPCAEKLSPISFHHHHYSPSSSATRKSPVRGMTSLHIPAKTSSLLLEAAMRIQQRQNHHQPKPKKTQMGFGLFGSILKKIMSKKNNITTTNGITMRREQTTSTTTTTGADEPRRSRQSSNTGCSEKHMMKTNETTTGTTEPTSRRQFSSTTTGCSEKRMIDDETCSCNHSRLSSSGWSETNETSSSCCRSDTEENELDNAVINGDFGSCDSPLSPFRFSLQKCPSSTGCRTPEFASSPAASPVCHKKEDKENYDDLANIEQEEDEKEQCSPVSVLDPPFDDDDGHEICEYEYEDEDDDDCCNYALVQRAQQQLLYKLRRFEKLAELDPIELEKLMLDEEEEGNDDLVDNIDDDDSMLSYKDHDFETFVSEVTIPFDMKRLVSDLISEEKTETKTSNNGEEEVVFGRVCKRLDSWQHVRSDTIDMMIESDLKNELDAWKKFQEQREETALEVEVEIFRLLVEELAEEIVYFDGHYGISNEVLAS